MNQAGQIYEECKPNQTLSIVECSEQPSNVTLSDND